MREGGAARASESDPIELALGITEPAPLRGEDASDREWQGPLHGLVVAILRPSKRTTARCDRVAAVAARRGHPDAAHPFAQELGPRAALPRPRGLSELREVPDEAVTLRRQSR